uniref:PB1 domain-containing protein n=1 Tax=Davidia involucrata TaxID=16924 RepID=A0A5B7C8P0_DAVIN
MKVKDGQVIYEGGIIDLIAVTHTSYEEFVHDACNALGIDSGGKTFHYSSKDDCTMLVRLNDDCRLYLMCRFNKDKVNVYINNAIHATPPNVPKTRESNIDARSPNPTILPLFEEKVQPTERVCTHLASQETNHTL